MMTQRCLDIASCVPAAAVIILCTGCDKPVIKIESPPVYQETLVEVEAAEMPDVRAKTAEDDATKITFDNLNLNLKPDTLFEDRMLTDTVQELIGKRVSLTGVMLDTSTFNKVDGFILLRNKEHPRGKGYLADHLISVKLRSGETTKYSADTVRATGTLHIEPFTGEDGVTWVIYVLKDATVAVE